MSSIDPLVALALGLAALGGSLVAAVAGFGGAAILLPALVWAFGPRDAVPILTVAQLIGNASRVWFQRTELSLHVVAWFALGAVPAALIGGLVFASTPSVVLLRLIGGFLIATVVYRHLAGGRAYRPAAWHFTPIGALFSFLSALVGSVGPLLAPFFILYGLSGGAYIGTEALATVVMRATALVAYGGARILGPDAIVVGLALGPVMIVGSYLGKRALQRVPASAFRHVIDGVLLVAGASFLLSR